MSVTETIQAARAGVAGGIFVAAGGLCLAASALVATTGGAAAQGFGRPVYPPYGVMPPGIYGVAPVPPGYVMRPPVRVTLAPGRIVAILRERHGFSEIGRPERDGPVYLVEAIDRRGALVAVVIDAFDGEVLSRDVIGRAVAGPRVVIGSGAASGPGAVSPREARPGAKVVTVPPQPPQRPAGLVAKAPEAASQRAASPALAPAASGVYPPPVDPRLTEKLGAK